MLVTVHFRELLLPDPSALSSPELRAVQPSFLTSFFFPKLECDVLRHSPWIPLHQQLVRINRRWEEEEEEDERRMEVVMVGVSECIRNVQQH